MQSRCGLHNYPFCIQFFIYYSFKYLIASFLIKSFDVIVIATIYFHIVNCI